MARLVLVTGSDPASLLRAAAAPASPSTLLAVRQGGLRDAVRELAPHCRVAVFAELPALFAGDLAPLDPFERAALLRRAIARVRPKILGAPAARRTVLAALDRLFGDLIAADVAPDALGRSLATLAPETWEQARDAELLSLYTEYLTQLAALPGRTDGRDGLLHAARAIASGRATLPRTLHLYGLADLRRGWRIFLDALRASPAVEEVCIFAPTVDEYLLSALDARLSAGASYGTASSWERSDDGAVPLAAVAESRAPSADSIEALASPDTLRELEYVARRIKQQIVEEHVSPSSIAVVAREARPHLTMAADLFARYGIPVDARLRHTLRDVPVVAALLRLLRVASVGWTIAGLRELSDSPYFTVDLDVTLLRNLARTARPRGLASWKQALDDLVARSDAEPPDTDEEIEDAERRRTRARAARDGWTRFAERAASLSERRTVVDWLGFTTQTVSDTQSGIFGLAANARRELSEDAPDILRHAARLDAAALDAVADLLARWRAAAALDPDADRAMDLGAWAAELERAVADREVTLQSGAPGGVQLLEALAAVGRSFEHLYMVGLSAGSFPSEPARDALFTDDERAMLHDAGLPLEPAHVWEARESALFQELIHAPRRTLHLSYAYADANGSPQLPAAYLDDLLARHGEQILTTLPGSALVPVEGAPLWSEDETLRAAAVALRDGRSDAASLLASAGGATGSPVVAQLLHAVAMEQSRAAARALPPDTPRAGRAHSYNGRIADAELLAHLRAHFGDRVWSATQLESYGRCPFSFFGRYALRAHAIEQDEDDEEVSGRDFGTVMHSALALTYAALRERFPANPLTAANFDVAREIVAASVHEAIERQGGAYVAVPALRAAREREVVILLEEYLHWEMRQTDKSKVTRRPLHMELGFGVHDAEHPPVQLKYEGRSVKLRGQIDRVDEVIGEGLKDFRYVVDHKAGASAFIGLESLRPAGGVLQLALYMLALEQLQPGTQLWGGVYQIVRKQERKSPLERCSVTQKGVKVLENRTQQQAEETIRDAARVALEIVDGILAGHFPARTPGNVDCLSYCEYRDVCREERIKSW